MDIVDKLRSLAVSLNASYSREQTLKQAADEIEHLRNQIEKLNSNSAKASCGVNQ